MKFIFKQTVFIIFCLCLISCEEESDCSSCISKLKTEDWMAWTITLDNLYHISDTNKTKAILIADSLLNELKSTKDEGLYPVHQKIEQLHYFKAEIFYFNNLPELSLSEIKQSGPFNKISHACIYEKLGMHDSALKLQKEDLSSVKELYFESKRPDSAEVYTFRQIIGVKPK